MPEHPLDQLIKERLANLHLAPLQTDWPHLVELLDEAFDIWIRDQLSSLDLPVPQTAWQAFIAMAQGCLDQQVAEKLSSLEIDMPADAWAHLLAKLDGRLADTLLIEKLDSWEPSLEEADWQLMRAELDQDPLFTHFAQALDDHDISYQANEWEAFQAYKANQLDQELSSILASDIPVSDHKREEDWALMAASLDGNAFDQTVRELLAQYQVPFVHQDWTEMLHILERPFDFAVKGKLDPLQLALARQSWPVMASRLKAEGMLLPNRTRPLWIKRSLAAAVTLLFMLAGTTWWITENKPGSPISGFIVKQIVQPLQSKQSDSLPSQVQSWEGEQLASAESITSESSLTGSAEIVNAESNPALNDIPPKPIEEVLNQPLHANASFVETPSPAVFLREEVEQQNNPSSARPKKPSLTNIPNHVGLAFAGSPQVERSLSVPLPGQESKVPDVSFGLYGAIATTKAELNDQAELGYSTGLRAEIHFNDHLSLVTGLLYGKKRFSHNYYYEDDSSSLLNRRRLEGELAIMDLPLLVRYRFPENDGLTLYTQAGIITTVSLSETYQSYNPQSSSNGGERVYQPERLNADEISGTRFNTYPGNIMIALGIEYEVADRVGVYLEPYYLQHLQRTKGSSSLGLNKRLYSFGLGLGVQYRFVPSQRKKTGTGLFLPLK